MAATKIGQLAQEIARQNPWWRDPGWADADPDLVQARSSGLVYQPQVLDDLVTGSLYLLRGPRRVGKTVVVKQCIASLLAAGIPPTSIVRAAVDGWSAKDLRTVVQNVAIPPTPDGVSRYWFLDEISAVTGDWAVQVKWLRDNDPAFHSATVVLTGSNAAELTNAAGVLAGRRGRAPQTDRTLLPIGFRTFVHLLSQASAPAVAALPLSDAHSPAAAAAYTALIPWIDHLAAMWQRYLSYGGFPVAVAAAKAGQPVPQHFVDDLFDVIANDTFANSRLNSLTEIALLERLWTAMGSPANLAKIAADTGVSQEVVSRHVGYLRDAFLLWACPQKSESSWLPHPGTQSKLYAVDPLVARLPHLRNAERSDIDPTILAEMQIGQAIRRRQIHDRPRSQTDESLFYVRTPTRKEIDFVAADLADAAIEGKFIDGGRWRREAQTVDASRWSGVLVTQNVLDCSGAGAWAVPAGILAYLLDT